MSFVTKVPYDDPDVVYMRDVLQLPITIVHKNLPSESKEMVAKFLKDKRRKAKVKKRKPLGKDEFYIHKVIEKGKKKSLVSWWGYGPEHNSWVDNSTIRTVEC